MAGPLSGIGAQAQQLPIATPFQPGGNANGSQGVRPRDDSQQSTQSGVQAENTNINQTLSSDAQDANALQDTGNERLEVSSQTFPLSSEPEEQPRGSIVNISV